MSANFNSEEQTTSAVTTSYIEPNIQVFRSPYFQFQTNKAWSEDTDKSINNTYVYRSLKGGVLEQQLTVYVNSAPVDLSASRVMPVAIKTSSALSASDVSENCGKASNYKSLSGITTIEGIKMKCLVDQTRYSILAGVVGGGTAINLSRPNETTASYTIFYSNVTAAPDSVELKEILNTFQAL